MLFKQHSLREITSALFLACLNWNTQGILEIGNAFQH
jgi:hypothetical protein